MKVFDYVTTGKSLSEIRNFLRTKEGIKAKYLDNPNPENTKEYLATNPSFRESVLTLKPGIESDSYIDQKIKADNEYMWQVALSAAKGDKQLAESFMIQELHTPPSFNSFYHCENCGTLPSKEAANACVWCEVIND